MGCCVVIRQDKLVDKDIIINLEENEKDDLIIFSDDLFQDNIEISNKTNNKKQRKISSNTIEANIFSNSNKQKNDKKIYNNCNQRIKSASKNLKKISISEVENIHNFFFKFLNLFNSVTIFLKYFCLNLLHAL